MTGVQTCALPIYGAAAQDEPSDTALTTEREQRARAVDMNLPHALGAARRGVEAARHVHDPFDPGRPLGESRAVPDLAVDEMQAKRLDERCPPPHQGHHLVPRGHGVPSHVGADEAGRAGEEDAHGGGGSILTAPCQALLRTALGGVLADFPDPFRLEERT